MMVQRTNSLHARLFQTFSFFQMFLPVFLVTLVFSWPVSFGLNTSFLKDRFA